MQESYQIDFWRRRAIQAQIRQYDTSFLVLHRVSWSTHRRPDWRRGSIPRRKKFLEWHAATKSPRIHGQTDITNPANNFSWNPRHSETNSLEFSPTTDPTYTKRYCRNKSSISSEHSSVNREMHLAVYTQTWTLQQNFNNDKLYLLSKGVKHPDCLLVSDLPILVLLLIEEIICIGARK